MGVPAVPPSSLTSKCALTPSIRKNAQRPSVITNVDEITLISFQLVPKEGIDRN